MNKLVILAVVILAGAGGYFWLSQKPTAAVNSGAVIIPQLTGLAAEGEAVYQGTCAACHGSDLRGTDNGPPLIHAFYRPNHHSDFSIVSAVQNGTPQHHWQFGNMPAQPQITDDQLVRLIAYIRQMQQANGIE